MSNRYVLEYNIGLLDNDEFRILAEKSANAGLTHVNISHIEKSIWQWNEDRTDPYPNWSTFRSSLFKFFIPEALKEYLPVDYAKRNEERLLKNAQILDEFGLKAAFTGFEPAYLPEQVYVDHPMWRGPRCDQTRRSRKEYYSPCVDNEEVLEMYREVMEKFCKAAPIESFKFLTNDSGGGLCWSTNLYPGKNGPKSCAHISFGERISKFMSALQEGAARAGVEATINIVNGMITQSEINDSVANLKPNQFVCGRGAKGSKMTTYGAGTAINLFNRVISVPQYAMLADSLASVADKDDALINVVASDYNDDEFFAVVESAIKNPEPGVTGALGYQLNAAQKYIGKEYANDLVTIWDKIETGIDALRSLDCGGHIFWIGGVHQRWITRPLVPFPGELKPEEKDYYRQFQFQATTEEDADDYLNIQGCSFIRGYAGVFMATRQIDMGERRLVKAISMIEELVAKIGDHKYAARLNELADRLRLTVCLCENSKNIMRFQDYLDRTDKSELPAHDTNPAWFEQGHPYFIPIKEIFRNEIDNTLEMISILEKYEKPLFTVAPTKDMEDICFLGPDIVDQLKKKIAIMQSHRNDFNRIYMSPNI